MRKQSLIIARDFSDYRKGQEIFNEKEIEKLLSGENFDSVIASSYEYHEQIEPTEKTDVIMDKKEIKKSVKFSK